MSWQQFKDDYLTFSKKDRIGILFLVLLIVLIYFLPLFFAAPKPGSALQADSAVRQAIDTLHHRQTVRANVPERPQWATGGDKGYLRSRSRGFTDGALFTFDPNTLPEEGWRQLGLNEKTSRTICRYREKGSRFYRPEDLRKIWGLPEGFYERVKGHIRIPPAPEKPYPARYPKEEKATTLPASVDINSADTAALIALPGIGSRLAARIVHFRDKLGGFYSVDQVGETYGLPDSAFHKLKPLLTVNPEAVKSININTASKEELSAHPYIKWSLANAVVEYRARHGLFGAPEDLKKILIVDDALFKKIGPYLSVE